MKLVYQKQEHWEVFHFKEASQEDGEMVAAWCFDNLDPDGEWRVMTPVMDFGNRFGRTGQKMGWPGLGDLLVLLRDPGDASLLRINWAQLTREPFR